MISQTFHCEITSNVLKTLDLRYRTSVQTEHEGDLSPVGGMKCLKNLFVATTRIEIFSGTKLSSNYEETKHYKTLIGHKTSYFLLSRAYNLSHLAFLVVLRKATQFFFHSRLSIT